VGSWTGGSRSRTSSIRPAAAAQLSIPAAAAPSDGPQGALGERRQHHPGEGAGADRRDRDGEDRHHGGAGDRGQEPGREAAGEGVTPLQHREPRAGALGAGDPVLGAAGDGDLGGAGGDLKHLAAELCPRRPLAATGAAVRHPRRQRDQHPGGEQRKPQHQRRHR
jgi:hypothetical protein